MSTVERYSAAASAFKHELESRGVDFDELDEEDQDWILAEHLVEGYHADLRCAWGKTLVSALQKMWPGRRLKTSWRVLDTWQVHQPNVQALPCPREVALACSVLLVFSGSVLEGSAILLCFVALLRISEALNLRIADVFTSAEGLRPVAILVLGRTKRGRDQRVVVSDKSVVDWLHVLIQHRVADGARKDDKLLPTSYYKVASKFGKACTRLGISDTFTTHSLRRGGATEMLVQQFSIETIMEYGRWASVSSCRLYLRRGEVALLRCRGSMADELSARISILSQIGVDVWRLRKPL